VKIANRILPDLSRFDYDAIGKGLTIYDAIVNWSTLKLLTKSPAHYRYALENPGDDETDAKMLGRAFHVASLEPHVYDLVFDVWKGGRRVGGDWNDFLASAILRGREVVTLEQHRVAKRMAKSARDCPPAAELLRGKREVTVTWHMVRPDVLGFGGYSIPCKGRLDLLTESGAIVDLKSTKDGSPDGFGREVFRYGYHLQLAHYRHGVELATGKRPPCYLLAVENFAPHVAQLYRVPDDVLEIGWRAVSELFDLLDFCRREKRWGGYFDAVMDLELPRYAYPLEDDPDDAIDPSATFENTH
jgi:hypothetical protein